MSVLPSNFVKNFSTCVCWIDLIFGLKHYQGELYRVSSPLFRSVIYLLPVCQSRGHPCPIDTFLSMFLMRSIYSNRIHSAIIANCLKWHFYWKHTFLHNIDRNNKERKNVILLQIWGFPLFKSCPNLFLFVVI